MALSASVKYVAICILTIVVAVVEYLQTVSFVLSEATVGAAVVLIVGLAIHDLETPAPATGTPPSS